MSFMNTVLKPPVHVTRGFAGTEMGGGNKKGGTFQIDNLNPNPLDHGVDSSSVARWSESTSWFGLGSTTITRSLEVTDKDASPDLRVTLEKTEDGKSELAVHNGSGARETEVRFDLGTLQDGAIADQLAAARAGSVKIEYEQKGDSQKATVTVGDQGFTFATK